MRFDARHALGVGPRASSFRSMWARLGGLVVLLLAVGACSSGGALGLDEDASDSGAEEQAVEEQAVEQLTAKYAGLDEPNAVRFTEDEARCAAEAVVEALGADRVVDLGPDLAEGNAGLDPEEQSAAYEALTGCIDLEAQTTDLLVAAGMTEDIAGCVAQRYLATDLAQQSMMGGYDPELNAEVDSALAEAYAACGGT
jgi:hypothetical protein